MAKKQKELPGIEKPVIKEIEDAADEYVEVRDKRMSLTEREVEKRAALIGVMRAHKVKSYKYDGRLITLKETDKVKVKTLKDEAGDED